MPYIKGDFDVFNGVMAIHISLVVPRQKLARKEVEKKKRRRRRRIENILETPFLFIFFLFFFFLFHLRVL
jgi:hypothetical protein